MSGLLRLVATVLAVAAPQQHAPRPLPIARAIAVPTGFRAELYATGFTHPTSLAFGPDGRLYVSEDIGNIDVATRGGQAHAFARGFTVPLGLTWLGHDLVVSEQGRLVRLRVRGGRVVGTHTLVSGLPFGLHQQDNVIFHAGRLYFGNGSTCDACREQDRRSASVLSLRPDGGGLRVEARGLRNPFGLAVEPTSGQLYVSVNGQDRLGSPGDPEPADMVVELHRGAFYGWPVCWPSARHESMVGACSGVTRPVAYLAPHSSADGIVFWQGSLFVAEWGEYLSNEFGRELVQVRLRGPIATRVRLFGRGFVHPLALALDPRSGLLVADWGSGVIYRIQVRTRA